MTLIKLFWFVILFSLFWLCCCTEETNSENASIVGEANSEMIQKFKLDSNLNGFILEHPVTVVISDKSCVTCNEKVVKVTSSLIGNRNFNVVLETGGRVFSIAPLLKDEYSNKVKFDHSHQLSEKYKIDKTFILKENSTTAISSDNAHQFEELLLASLSGK